MLALLFIELLPSLQFLGTPEATLILRGTDRSKEKCELKCSCSLSGQQRAKGSVISTSRKSIVINPLQRKCLLRFQMFFVLLALAYALWAAKKVSFSSRGQTTLPVGGISIAQRYISLSGKYPVIQIYTKLHSPNHVYILFLSSPKKSHARVKPVAKGYNPHYKQPVYFKWQMKSCVIPLHQQKMNILRKCSGILFSLEKKSILHPQAA